MEVILLEYQVPDDIAAAATQEDVDVIGLSFMSGGQVDVTRRLLALLEESGAGDLPVVIGGTIRPFDVPALEDAGVKAIFQGGETLASVVGVFADLAGQSPRNKAHG
jgi:methylmalonyl-CoA mutase C-terminal domain/subunit